MTCDWHLRGEWFDVCSRSMSCPCSFARAPTHGKCLFTLAWQLHEGHLEQTRLDGLGVVVLGSSPGTCGPATPTPPWQSCSTSTPEATKNSAANALEADPRRPAGALRIPHQRDPRLGYASVHVEAAKTSPTDGPPSATKYTSAPPP